MTSREVSTVELETQLMLPSLDDDHMQLIVIKYSLARESPTFTLRSRPRKLKLAAKDYAGKIYNIN